MKASLQQAVTTNLRLTHFICVDCSTSFSMTEEELSQNRFVSTCVECKRPISIQANQDEGNLQVLELFGCEYSFVGHSPRPLSKAERPKSSDEILEWIGKAKASAPASKSSTDFEERPNFMDNLTAKWTVKSSFGRKRDFEYFAELRKAIEEGEVKATDRIIAPDGQKFHAETYPGTADLFGHPELKIMARSKMNQESSKYKIKTTSPFKSFIRKVMLIMVSATIGSMTFFGKKYYEAWLSYQANRVIEEKTKSFQLSPGEVYESLLVEGRKWSSIQNPETLPKAVEAFSKALIFNPDSLEARAGLAESLMDLSQLTADTHELKKAKKILNFLRFKSPDDRLVIRAQIHYLSRIGLVREAFEELEKQPETFYQTVEDHLFAAKRAKDAKEYTQALLHLNQALQDDTKNIGIFVELSNLYEAQGKFAQSALYLSKAQKLSGPKTFYAAHLAELFEKSGDSETAITVLKKAIDQGENIEANRYRLIKIYSSKKLNSEAMSEAITFLALHHDSAYTSEVRNLYQENLKLSSAGNPQSTGTQSVAPRSKSVLKPRS